MRDDPTISFAGYTFLASKGCAACRHVMDGAPVLLFVHEKGGGLQMLCGAAGHVDDDRRWVHVIHILDAQPDLFDLPTVDLGFEAERDGKGRWLARRANARLGQVSLSRLRTSALDRLFNQGPFLPSQARSGRDDTVGLDNVGRGNA